MQINYDALMDQYMAQYPPDPRLLSAAFGGGFMNDVPEAEPTPAVSSLNADAMAGGQPGGPVLRRVPSQEEDVQARARDIYGNVLKPRSRLETLLTLVQPLAKGLAAAAFQPGYRKNRAFWGTLLGEGIGTGISEAARPRILKQKAREQAFEEEQRLGQLERLDTLAQGSQRLFPVIDNQTGKQTYVDWKAWNQDRQRYAPIPGKPSPQTPHTVTVGERIMQFNPETGKFDIDVGAAPTKTDTSKSELDRLIDLLGPEKGLEEFQKRELERRAEPKRGLPKNLIGKSRKEKARLNAGIENTAGSYLEDAGGDANRALELLEQELRQVAPQDDLTKHASKIRQRIRERARRTQPRRQTTRDRVMQGLGR